MENNAFSLNADNSWLQAKALSEMQSDTVAAGVHCIATTAKAEPALLSTRPAFGRLVQLARRNERLPVEAFAQRVGVAVSDIVSIETDNDYLPTPRTVYKFASYFKVPEAKLMTLAGHLVARDVHLQEAAERFAARSLPIEKLSSEEQKALNEFVRVLSEL